MNYEHRKSNVCFRFVDKDVKAPDRAFYQDRAEHNATVKGHPLFRHIMS